MTKTIYPASLLCDFYKVSHKDQYPEGTEFVYSTWTPRSNKYFPKADKVVTFGIQAFIKKYLINYFNEHFFNRPRNEVVEEYKRIIKFTLGQEEVDASHIEELHELGHLPIKIRAIKEGTRVPVKVPMMTIENTDKRFFWVTNYLETLLSNEVWLPMTSATIAHTYRQLLDEYALKL
ncbi:nicotinamide phosphoribosyltransferase domain-containing protein [Bacillus glycinifermentans]|uniref:nicotinamide phosphoribosyltransferase domain-containing protein n=1 Tax=Bacillus glycinifermentans TaxID=1664069 RepID=UPI001F1AD659|nr:nicotinamide phosphoribosyltransferase domain-containing protein [Bacillus glycinifermentans]